jgi:hypothetical protein
MSARNYQNANSTMSLAYAWHLSMTVKNGILHGERGNRGMGDFYEINGTIAADGTAAIRADGKRHGVHQSAPLSGYPF